MVTERKFFGLAQDVYFRDIGIPEDHQLADRELRALPLKPEYINKQWTLFLDRDGVLNHEKQDKKANEAFATLTHQEKNKYLSNLQKNKEKRIGLITGIVFSGILIVLFFALTLGKFFDRRSLREYTHYIYEKAKK